MSHKYTKQAGKLLQEFPHLEKWINQCVYCQKIGCKSQTPKTPKQGKEHGYISPSERLRNNYEIVELDEFGVCEDCRKIIKQEN